MTCPSVVPRLCMRRGRFLCIPSFCWPEPQGLCVCACVRAWVLCLTTMKYTYLTWKHIDISALVVFPMAHTQMVNKWKRNEAKSWLCTNKFVIIVVVELIFVQKVTKIAIREENEVATLHVEAEMRSGFVDVPFIYLYIYLLLSIIARRINK